MHKLETIQPNVFSFRSMPRSLPCYLMLVYHGRSSLWTCNGVRSPGLTPASGKPSHATARSTDANYARCSATLVHRRVERCRTGHCEWTRNTDDLELSNDAKRQPITATARAARRYLRPAGSPRMECTSRRPLHPWHRGALVHGTLEHDDHIQDRGNIAEARGLGTHRSTRRSTSSHTASRGSP